MIVTLPSSRELLLRSRSQLSQVELVEKEVDGEINVLTTGFTTCDVGTLKTKPNCGLYKLLLCTRL
jgi:hypothetical protein